MGNKLFVVGTYVEKFNEITGQHLPCGSIYQSTGLVSHVCRHHPDTGATLLPYVPVIIEAPDYVGRNPKEPNSVELVKQIDQQVMVCIKLDSKNGYLYVASVFEIKQSKLERRIASGRLQKY